jgi:hypothetical protein
MAQTVYQNPEYFKGPVLNKVKQAAKDGQTWQAGQFGRRTDSGWVLCKSAATSIQGQFLTTQATATSSSNVYVGVIPSNETKFKIGVTTGGNDAKAPATIIGANYGLGVNSSICTLSLGADTAGVEALHVEDIMSNLEGFKNDTSDSPGFAVVSVVSSFLTAEGAGL